MGAGGAVGGPGGALGLAHTSGVSFPQQPSFSSSAPLTPQIAILVFGAGHKASGPEAAYAMVGSGCPPTPPCENEDGGSGRGDVSPVLSQGALTSACPWLLLIGPVPPLVSWGLQRGNKGSRQPGEGGCLRGVGPLACSFLGEASFSVPAHLSGGASWVTGPGGDELRCPAPRKAQPDEWAHTWGREDRVSETLCQCAPRRGVCLLPPVKNTSASASRLISWSKILFLFSYIQFLKT